jgi:hypothetical protein
MNSFIRNNKRYNENCESILKLGNGSFGSVFKVQLSNRDIAVKIMDLREKSERNLF